MRILKRYYLKKNTMEINRLLDEILNLDLFTKKPVVLLDIGASGEIHADWKPIAKHCICVAFDADDREFSDKNDSSGFKKLHLINKIVSDKIEPKISFYLTQSPFCSSTLEPLNTSLQHWEFHKLFDVVKHIDLPNTTLFNCLNQLNLETIDWFKTDSQGTDLRLFTSLPLEWQKKIMVAEFEPGIIDAYKGEDKLWNVLSYMDKMPFWVSELNVQGTKRISKTVLEQLNITPQSRINIPVSSCWGEITYFNTFSGKHTLRDVLLGWVFCTLKKQHGFALELINNVRETSDQNDLLRRMKDFSNKQITVAPKSSIKTKIRNRLIYYLNKW